MKKKDFIKKMLGYGANLETVISPIEVSGIYEDADLLYDEHIKELNTDNNDSFVKALRPLVEQLHIVRVKMNHLNSHNSLIVDKGGSHKNDSIHNLTNIENHYKKLINELIGENIFL